MSYADLPPPPSGEPEPVEPSPAASLPEAAPAPAVPEDLRAPWTGIDLLIFAMYCLGMLVLLTNALAALAALRYGVPESQIAHFSTTNAGFIVCRQVLWFLSMLFYFYALLRRRISESFWRALGWRGLRLRPLAAPLLALIFLLGGCVLAIVADAASEFYTTQKQLPIQALFTDRRGVLYLMAYGILVAPLAEETLFRGIVYPVLARKFGIFAGITVTGILFGLAHALQLWGGWGQIVTLVAVGMALTAVRAAMGSVAASYLLHLGYNGFLFGGFWFATDALRHLPK